MYVRMLMYTYIYMYIYVIIFYVFTVEKIHICNFIYIYIYAHVHFICVSRVFCLFVYTTGGSESCTFDFRRRHMELRIAPVGAPPNLCCKWTVICLVDSWEMRCGVHTGHAGWTAGLSVVVAPLGQHAAFAASSETS